MNSLEHLRELFTYNDWANRRVIFALRDSPSQKGLEIMSHILITENEYYERLYGKDSTGFDFWQKLSRDECKELVSELSDKYFTLLKNFDDEGLDLSVSYKTSEGISEKNTYREILTHVLLHSMSHRGQINTVLRKEGFEPIANDYIIYLRMP